MKTTFMAVRRNVRLVGLLPDKLHAPQTESEIIKYSRNVAIKVKMPTNIFE